MIEQSTPYLEISFLAVTVITIVLFHLSNAKPKLLTMFIVIWSILQSMLAYVGFYEVLDDMPPRFAAVLLPLIFVFIYALRPRQIDWMIRHRNTQVSTFLHTIRIGMEFILYYLFIAKLVPELMTFEGRNFDILAGITAPIVGLLYYYDKLSKPVLLIWNFIGLALILFIFINGTLSAELPFQQFGFEQPNKAVTLFPYILLPATVVPIVVYTHIADIIKLKREIKIR